MAAAKRCDHSTTLSFRLLWRHRRGDLGTLQGGQPVVLGLLVTDAFQGPWRIVEDEAVLPDDGLPPERRFGHAVVAVGTTRRRAPSADPEFVGAALGSQRPRLIAEQHVERRFLGAFTVREGN